MKNLAESESSPTIELQQSPRRHPPAAPNCGLTSDPGPLLSGRMMRFFVFLLLAAAIPGSGCSSGPQSPGFTKVKYYHLEEESDDEQRKSDRGASMIRFERAHHLHGAVNRADREARYGHYYTFFWRGRPGSGPLTLRFEYRQAETAEQVHRIEQRIVDVQERNVTRIQIIGEPYHLRGPVTSWRASLWDGERMLDEERSFLWRAPIE